MTDPTADAAKLLPCPFCGTQPLGSPLNNTLEPKRSLYLLQCPSGKCPVRPKVYGTDRADAKRRWNTRPQPAPPAGEPEHLREPLIELLAKIEDGPYIGAAGVADAVLELIGRLGLAARPKVEDAEKWRCFHCGEVFTDRLCAEDHFGVQPHFPPGCVEKLTPQQAESRAIASRAEAEAHREFVKKLDLEKRLKAAEAKVAEREAELAAVDTIIDNQWGTMTEIDKYKFQKITNAAITRHAARQPQKDKDTR